MRGRIGRWIRVWACRRVLADLYRERTQYGNIQRTNAYENGFYTGFHRGLDHAIHLIETEYR